MSNPEKTTSVETQPAAPQQPETTNVPAAPDAAAKEALKQTEELQAARVTLVQEAAPKPKVEGASADAPAAGSEAVTPPALPTTQAEAKEPEFLDSVLKYYDASKARGKGTFGATFDAVLFALTSGSTKLWDWVSGTGGDWWTSITDFVSGKKKEEKAPQAEEEDPHYRTEDEYYEPDDPETKKLAGKAKSQLDTALDKNPTWLACMTEAGDKFNISVPDLCAMIRFESGFNPNAVNGAVAGLGQFWGPTWERFMAENPEFKGASRTDPRASIYATAWYARKNATECKIDTNAPNAAALLYEAHHEGAGGFAQLQAFRRGEITDKQKIPKTYKGKSFPKLGVTLVDTYEHYAQLVTAMSAKVQTVADFYKTELPEIASQEPNS